MKTLLSASLFVVSLAYAPPADSGAPPQSPPTAPTHEFCVVPTAPTAKGTPPYPLGGASAPDVGCHDDKKLLKDVGAVRNVRFKLFVHPERAVRLDYVWNKPNEIQAACRNACIEQRKLCNETYAKGDKVKSSHCAVQEKACIAAQKPSTVAFQKKKCDAS